MPNRLGGFIHFTQKHITQKNTLSKIHSRTYLPAVCVIYLLDLFSSSDILFCSKSVCMHPCLHNFHSYERTNKLSSKTKNVCIIVLSSERSAERILADAGINAVNLVRNHCTSIADSVYEYSPLAFTLRYGK